jgi:hypothetical protein
LWHDLAQLPTLFPYISPHDLFINVAYCLGKISIRPETIAPQELLQLWVFFPYHSTRSTLQRLYHFCHTIAWLRLDDKMDMVLSDTQRTNPPPIHPACLVQQSPQADGYFTSQYPPTIFRYPHQVVLQAVFRMGPGLISGHGQIMPEIAPLRQVSPGYASKGGHSSPGLKAWGFLARFIKATIQFG